MIGRVLLYVAASVLVMGCTEGPLSSLSRTAEDPFIAAPKIVSLQKENRVDLSWEEDENAEEYILERTPDAAILSYSVVYRGTDTAYVDDGLIDQSRFLYRLTKTRGTRSFGPSDSVMGVGSASTVDASEPNDEMENATELVYDLVGNMYYYQSFDGKVLQDVDWYVVSIPPRRKANIIVTQPGLVAGTQDTYFFFYETGIVPVTVKSDVAIEISNTSYETKKAFFKIYPKAIAFATNLTLGGGTLVNYTVSLHSIIGL